MDLSDQKTQIILVIVLGIAGLVYAWYTYLYTPRKEDITTLTEEITTFEGEIATFQLLANRRSEVEAQLAAAQAQWSEILLQFPTEAREQEILANMSVAEEASRLYPISFDRGERRVQDLYIEQDYSIRLLGEYSQIGRYIATLAGQPRRMSIARMQITHPTATEGGAGGTSAGPLPTEEEVFITLTVTSYVVRVR